MSNTPRTDQIMKFSFGDDREYVTVEFARKLESELTSMTQQRDALIMFLECEMNWSFFRAEYQLGENPTQHELNGNKIREYLQAKGWEAR